MPEETMQDTLTRLAEIDKEVKDLGITPKNFDQIKTLIAEYQEQQAILVSQRDAQFYDSARAFCVQQRIAHHKNVNALSIFLRQFAEHILQEAVMNNLIGIDTSVVDVADHLSNLVEEEEKYDE